MESGAADHTLFIHLSYAACGVLLTALALKSVWRLRQSRQHLRRMRELSSPK